MTTSNLTAARTSRVLANKVPQVLIFFWLIKILSTTMGETVADWFDSQFGLGLPTNTAIFGALFLVVLAWQMSLSTYVAGVYWGAVVLVSITGTLITDNLTDNVGVPLWQSTIVFSAALAVVFLVWWRQERSLDIAAINTTKREAFYWLAILVTFALGTAAGDLITEGFDDTHPGIGYRNGLLLFIGLVLSCYAAFKLKVSGVLTFWIAYVLTRPLGACLGDYLTAPKVPNEDYAYTGLGLDRYQVNGVFMVLVLALVSFLAVSKVDRIKSTTHLTE